ncbi:MAG TPA: DUF4345 domain-containing protein [Saliniramus sp.]|nr:DUF4345 domain-containing protein [Saliniramus sp.]
MTEPRRERSIREKRLLQTAVVIFGFIPVLAGLAGVLTGGGFLGSSLEISTDSHLRYLSGLLLGIGLCFWSTVPRIETKTSRFRLLTLIVVIGGLGRAYALATIGAPSTGMMLALGMELVVTPGLCCWQGRVASASV